MARWSLLLYSLCSAACAASAMSDSAINYGVLNTLLQSPVRQPFERDVRRDDAQQPGQWGEGVVQEDNNTTGSAYMGPIVAAEVPATPSSTAPLDDVSLDNELPKTSERASSNPIIDEGINKITEIYKECTTKIDKRIESLLGWKLSRENVQENLVEMKDYVSLLYRCLKVQSFRYFDGIVNENVIPITDFVDLVRDRSASNPSLNVSPDARMYLPSMDTAQPRVTPNYVTEIVTNDWSALLLDRLSKLLETHSMKFRINDNTLQGRSRRRRDHKMVMMMLMGFMVMASILIPMGFQFLTVLGGKSLLMAKMALIMSAINGLKKIATSPVGYGFYHTGPDAHHDHGHHHGFHDKLFKINKQPEFL